MKSKANILCGILFLSVIVSTPSAKVDQPKVLFDFGKEFPLASVGTQDASVSLSDSGALHIAAGHTSKWPGITLKAPQGKWDLSAYSCLTADIRNCGSQSVTVNCRVDNPHADGSNNCVTGTIMLEAGGADRLVVMLYPTPWVLSEPVEIIGMRGWPKAAGKLDTSNVVGLLFFVSDPSTDHLFEVDNITVAGSVKRIDAKKLFPMIDQFGQFIHDDWPGKIHSVSDLQQTLHTELADISDHTSPADRNKYGGWTKGPQLEATGYFRVQKHKDKWWLIDPEGRLFWSHGIDCVRAGSSTPITDRQHYYALLPDDNSPLAQFYGSGNWAPHGYYNEHSPYKTYDFNSADLLRKYGSDWNDAFARMAHRRIRSWGMNTIANWSDSNIYLMRQTPYTANLSFDSRKIEGSEGYWGRFSDVFDDGFPTAIRQAVAREKGKSLGDPWCIGYFVHNELGWGDEVSLAIGALKSPPDQPAKLVFIADLKAKYKTIDKLNSIWDTNHKSWDDLAKSTESPDKKKAWDDLTAFYTKIAETYFAVIRDEIKNAAPNQMYFGCRFAWVNDRAARAAAKYCDVVCYNRYSYSVADHRLPDNIDMPIIVGEFHFGALDRGMFHTGLKETIDQNDRAAKYTSYVEGALRNPYIVGTHWFQFTSQATTGRGDGENYQIGFLDGCDTPYSEIIAAARTIGDEMYEYRLR